MNYTYTDLQFVRRMRGRHWVGILESLEYMHDDGMLDCGPLTIRATVINRLCAGLDMDCDVSDDLECLRDLVKMGI